MTRTRGFARLNRAFVAAILIVIIIALGIPLYYLGVTAQEIGIGETVAVVAGILITYLLRERETHPELRIVLPGPDSEEVRQLSEAEKMLRKKYPKVFVLFDSIGKVRSQREYDRLEARGKYVILLETLEIFPSNSITKLQDRGILEAILLARLSNASDFERHWWQ